MKKLLLLLVSCQCFAQLTGFSIAVSSTPQTCLGNGSLTFAVSGNNPAATMEYAVYLLPNTTMAVTTVTTPYANNLVAGLYRVVATQSLNGSSNTATADAVIANNGAPLNYSGRGVFCSGSGTITITVTAGSAVSYEIIAGPQTRPQQPSNIFTGLPLGQYQVRVHDSCGDAIVSTVQVVNAVANYSIGGFEPDMPLPSCSQITVKNIIHNGNNPVNYPITAQYTINPPAGGTATVISQVMDGSVSNMLYANIPFYNGQLYSYTLKITDACGNTFQESFQVPITRYDYEMELTSYSCGVQSVKFIPEYYIAPYTITFLSAPAGFNATLANSNHPSHTAQSAQYGSSSNPLPQGQYNVRITDACGRQQTKFFRIGSAPPAVLTTAQTSCSGKISILPTTSLITSVTVVSSPSLYDGLIDLTSQIVNGSLIMDNVPAGTYRFAITDSCGGSFVIEVIVPAWSMPEINIIVKEGCGTDEGSMNITLLNSQMEKVEITAAPQNYGTALPHDISGMLNDDSVSLDSLPAGDYTVKVTDVCGFISLGNFTIEGYTVLQDNINIIENCNSFDIAMHYENNSPAYEKYYLQRYIPELAEWGHPIYNQAYPGDLNFANSEELINFEMNYNFPQEGQYRIMRVGRRYISGSSWNFFANCTSAIKTFTYDGRPQIERAYSFPCLNGLTEVLIVAQGFAPLSYAIIEKNGDEVLIDNENSAHFTALENAVYKFRVTDSCGSINTIEFDTSELGSFEIVGNNLCNGQDGTLSLPYFTFLTYEWFKNDNPAAVLSTDNILNLTDFNVDADSGAYSARVVSTTPGSCIDVILGYNVNSSAGNAGADMNIQECKTAAAVNLDGYLVEPYDQGGIWNDDSNTGMLNANLLNTSGLSAGVYYFSYVVTKCETVDTAVLALHIGALNTFSVALAQGCTDDEYKVWITNTDELAGAAYSWTGPEGFTFSGAEITITGLPVGRYEVTVTKPDGCAAIEGIVAENTLCKLPRGISPNGDGRNDTLDLSNFDVTEIQIFNRYGLKVYEQANYVNEWHGQSDKGDLPTGTYFYVISLESGKQVTGWVYLQREL